MKWENRKTFIQAEVSRVSYPKSRLSVKIVRPIWLWYYKTHMIFGICLETLRHIGQITSQASTRQKSIFGYQSGFYGPWNRDQTSVTIGVKNVQTCCGEKWVWIWFHLCWQILTSLSLNDLFLQSVSPWLHIVLMLLLPLKLYISMSAVSKSLFHSCRPRRF